MRALFHGFTSTLVSLVSVVSLCSGAACGGSSPEPKTPSEHAEHSEHEEHGEHGKLPPPVHAFHEVLAPLWHMGKGAERTAKTCEKAMTLNEKASATGDKELVAATTSLVAECEKEGKPDFDARFKTVHERFHALAEK
jgi:hypothetical protein